MVSMDDVGMMHAMHAWMVSMDGRMYVLQE